MSGERAPNAVGTYGFLDVLRHPSRIVRPPKASDSGSDVEAVRRGEARRVLEESSPSRKLKQGRLQLSSTANLDALLEPSTSANGHRAQG